MLELNIYTADDPAWLRENAMNLTNMRRADRQLNWNDINPNGHEYVAKYVTLVYA